MNIIAWLKDKFSGKTKKSSAQETPVRFVPSAKLPTIEIVYPEGCREYADFLMKNIDKMETRIIRTSSSYFSDNSVTIRIEFSLPYLTAMAYELKNTKEG